MSAAQKRKASPAAARGAQSEKGKFGAWLVKKKGQLGDIVSEMLEISRDEYQKVDVMLLCIILILVAVGSIMMFSASYASALEAESTNHDSFYYIKKQFVWAALGFAAMAVLSAFPVKRLKDYSSAMVVVSIVLLCAVFGFKEVNGVHRWMLGFQPSEFTKFVVIVYGAEMCDKYYREMEKINGGIIRYLIFVAVTAVLLFFEPHVSCMIIVALLCVTMLFIGGAKLGWFAGFAGLGIGAYAAIMIFRKYLEENHLMARIYDRLDVWHDPFVDPTGGGWQNIQGLYAISSGGLTGQGIGNSRQKYLYISEPQNDFIFSVVAEEVGFIGSVLIILLFMIFVWRGLTVSVSNTNRFCKYIGVGITAQVGWQALLNMMVVTGIAPNTGISLPFFSYGGSSLVMLLAEMGVLLAISRQSPIKRV